MDSRFHACSLKRYACLRVAASAEAGRASTGLTESSDLSKYDLSLYKIQSFLYWPFLIQFVVLK